MNLYQYVGHNPMNDVDPYGLLQRQQVNFLGFLYNVPGWRGVGPASPEKIKDAIARIKDELRQQFPEAGFTPGGNWNPKDDKAMQKMLNSMRGLPALLLRDGPDRVPWILFPGRDTSRCLDCKEINQAIKDALDEFKQLDGGKLDVDQNFLLAWTMKESNWDEAASAYASSAVRPKNISTAIGLLQITKSTYEDYARRRPKSGLFKKYGTEWDENALSTAKNNIVASLFLLQDKPGSSTTDKLKNYYGKNQADNADYVRKILAGKEYLDRILKGKSIDQLSDADCKKLGDELDKIVHPR